jgi:hypothetical protein
MFENSLFHTNISISKFTHSKIQNFLLLIFQRNWTFLATIFFFNLFIWKPWQHYVEYSFIFIVFIIKNTPFKFSVLVIKLLYSLKKKLQFMSDFVNEYLFCWATFRLPPQGVRNKLLYRKVGIFLTKKNCHIY